MCNGTPHPGDTKEQIERCLSCEEPECINCWALSEQRRMRMKKTSGTVIQQFNPHTNYLIATYPDAETAAAAMGIRTSSINRAIRGLTQRAAGYVWREIPKPKEGDNQP